jgi:hypothetical protein
MSNRIRAGVASILIVSLLAVFSNAQALSIDIVPGSTSTSLDVLIDFTADPTVGGGIDLAFSGPIAFTGFTPSAFFNGLDTTFSGFGTADADADFEIHFGDFAGVAGPGVLGTLNFSQLDLGATVALAINTTFGDFFSAATFDPQVVALNGFTVVPVPAAVWLFGSALGLLAGVRRSRAA